MKKRFVSFLLVLLLIFAVNLCSCDFLNNEGLFANSTKTDYVKLINDVTLNAVKSNVKVVNTNSISGSVFFGSGSIIKKENSVGLFPNDVYTYYCLTNNHVISGNDFKRISIEDYIGRKYDAEILFFSSTYDLALLKFSTENILSPITISSTDAKVNDEVISVGQPEGQLNAITIGKILEISETAISGDADSDVRFKVVMHDAYINNGSSGGMLINTSLELVGVNYAGLNDVETGESLNRYCAIPRSKVVEFLSLYKFDL